MPLHMSAKNAKYNSVKNVPIYRPRKVMYYTKHRLSSDIAKTSTMRMKLLSARLTTFSKGTQVTHAFSRRKYFVTNAVKRSSCLIQTDAYGTVTKSCPYISVLMFSIVMNVFRQIRLVQGKRQKNKTRRLMRRIWRVRKRLPGVSLYSDSSILRTS